MSTSTVPQQAPAQPTPAAKEQTPWRRFARQFIESKLAVVGLITLLLIILIAIFAPLLAPQNPYDLATLDVLDARLAPGEQAGSGMTFLLGSDEQGRDMLSAVMYGLRISVGVGVVSTVIALLLGATLGLLAGFLGGRTEAFIMRVADLQLSFPPILLALILLASMLYLLVALGIGLVISAAVKNQFLASQMALLTSFLPALMLSGFLFDLRSLPIAVRVISHVLPATYYVELLQTLFLAGNVWPLILKDCAVLLLAATLLLTLARVNTRKRLA